MIFHNMFWFFECLFKTFTDMHVLIYIFVQWFSSAVTRNIFDNSHLYILFLFMLNCIVKPLRCTKIPWCCFQEKFVIYDLLILVELDYCDHLVIFIAVTRLKKHYVFWHFTKPCVMFDITYVFGALQDTDSSCLNHWHQMSITC